MSEPSDSALGPRVWEGLVDLVVVLADPRLPNPDHPSGRQDDHDRRDVVRLREMMPALVGGCRITYLDDHETLLDDLRASTPDLVLNFCNAGFRNRPELQLHIPALLELLGLPFAGADAASLALCHDKSGVHAAAERLRIAVPRHDLLRLGVDGPDSISGYPALLKPNSGSGSEGITARSVVRDQQEASRCLAELASMRCPPDWVVAEQFLPGQEITVAVLGNPDAGGAPTCLPPLEIGYERLPEPMPRILTHLSKTDEDSQEWQAITTRRANLRAAARDELEHHCARLFDRLGCRDYARFDFRADEHDTLCLIDANAHPEWGGEGLIARMAEFAGLGYAGLLDRIIKSARGRYLAHDTPAQQRHARE